MIQMQIGTFKAAAASGGFWTAWLLLGAALLIPSPTADFFLAFLAVTAAVLPLAFGDTKRRIGALVALLLAVALAGSMVDRARHDPYFKKNRTTPSLQRG